MTSETQPQRGRPLPRRSLSRLVLPAAALLAALAWYVGVHFAEQQRLAHSDGQAIAIASEVMAAERAADRARLESECALLAYDPRLGAILRTEETPLIYEFMKNIERLLPDTGVAFLSIDGTLITSNIRALDQATIRSSSLIDRVKKLAPQAEEEVVNRAQSGFWIVRGEAQVLEVSVCSVSLGEPVGMLALTRPLEHAVRQAERVSGVSGAIAVGSEPFHAQPSMQREMAELSNVAPGPPARLQGNVVQVEELDAAGLGTRAIWVEHPPSSGDALFSALLWIPIVGAVLFGFLQARAIDRAGRA